MEWNHVLQEIIEYVEIHLQRTEEPLNPKEVSQLAGCSYSFFQKVFAYTNGISFAEYVRCRKLTLAGYDLKSTNRKIVDISYQYGYDSPTSFTKAFQQFHGVTPKEARNAAVNLQVFPKLQIAQKQGYSWRIAYKQRFRLIGVSTSVSCKNQMHMKSIPEFWNACQRDGTYARLISLDQGSPKGLFGLFGFHDAASEQLEYAILAESNAVLPPYFTEIQIPAATWAVFDCKGPVPNAIQQGWKYLQEEWLVQYPFKHAACPELEWYSDGNVYDESYLSQIWIPIVEEE